MNTFSNPSQANQLKTVSERFRRDGYVLLSEMFSTEEIAKYRSFLERQFDRSESEREIGDTGKYFFDVFNRYPELRPILWHPRLVASLREILGEDFVHIRETAAHRNNYSGWHKDTSAQEKGGLTFHLQPDFLQVQVGLYLQANTKEFGGGLDVKPQSVHEPDPLVRSAKNSNTKKGFFGRLFHSKSQASDKYSVSDILQVQDAESILNAAGDMVIFDYRILHRATPIVENPLQNKLAIFMAFSRNNIHLDNYHNFIGHRDDYHYLKNYKFSPGFEQESLKNGVRLG